MHYSSFQPTPFIGIYFGLDLETNWPETNFLLWPYRLYIEFAAATLFNLRAKAEFKINKSSYRGRIFIGSSSQTNSGTLDL